MTAALTELLGLAQVQLAAAFLVFLRIGAVMALVPGFGERTIPVRLRLALTLAFTIIVLPAVTPMLPPEMIAHPLRPDFILREALAGLALGLVLRIMVNVLQIAGTIAGQSTSLSQILGGAGVDPQPAMAHVLILGGLALAMMAGLHVRVAEAMILSYEAIPPGRGGFGAILAEWSVAHVARGFRLALTLALPFVIGAFLYNLALGVINRAMPQLMVAFVGAPAITAGGLMLLALAAPGMLWIWAGQFMGVLADPFGTPP